MGPKIYTVREAEACLPALESAFDSLDQIRSRLRKIKGKIDVLEMLWGEEIHSEANPDHREYDHYVAEVEKLKQDYESATKRIGDLEVVLKSVESGLIDFYGVIDGHLVFLCWKRGEKGVEFFHHLEDGFAGRQAIAHEYKT